MMAALVIPLSSTDLGWVRKDTMEKDRKEGDDIREALFRRLRTPPAAHQVDYQKSGRFSFNGLRDLIRTPYLRRLPHDTGILKQ